MQDGNNLLLRFSKGEEVVAGLIAFALQEKIGAAHYTAIGAAGEVVLSYYNLQDKQYQDTELKENLEIVSVIGNIAHLESKPVVHCHGTFSRQDLSVVGGHIKKLVVSATCEVYLNKLPATIARAFDEETGLNLLQ